MTYGLSSEPIEPTPADFDGDGKADIDGVASERTGRFYIFRRSSDGVYSGNRRSAREQSGVAVTGGLRRRRR